MSKVRDEYTEKEAQERFEKALRGGLKAPPKPRKEASKKKGVAKTPSVRKP